MTDSPADPPVLLEANGLTRRFGRFVAAAEVGFRIHAGEIVGLLGPNGAGKSTVLRMLTGFLAPDAGFVRVAGADPSREPRLARERLGYLPERGPLYDEMTVAEFLAFAARVRRQPVGPAVARALERCDLGPVANQTIDTLSKGYRQRVGLAQALLHEPPVLLLDEPMDGLDPNQKATVRALLTRLAPGRAILFSTHVLEDVSALCHRVIILARGRLVAETTAAELQARHGDLAQAFAALTSATSTTEGNP